MRESDKIKANRSFTTDWNQGRNQWEVKGSSWLPGYTSAHKETREEAIQYRIDLLGLEQKRLETQVKGLQEVLQVVKEKNK